MTDPAIRFFLDDAKAQGLSVREYERRYGVVLLPAEREIASREVPLSAEMETRASGPTFRSVWDGVDTRRRAPRKRTTPARRARVRAA